MLLVLLPVLALSQSKTQTFFTPSDSLNVTRRNTVITSQISLSAAALIGLNQIWYADFERSKFHTVNDNQEWLQMDKLGHAFTSYQLGKHGAQLLNWSGVNQKDQLLYGATIGFAFLTAVEVLDGFSKEWGFSWGDVLANGAGAGFYVGQELLWNEQRIDLKYSFHQTMYAPQNPDKLGKSLAEQVLKDYNGQTYWLSFNLYSFLKTEKMPKWLNLAIGYGGEGMLYGLESLESQMLTNNRRYRQFYLSFDVNLSKIETKSKLLATVFDVFNMIKIPLPTLEISKKGSRFYPFFI